MKQQFRVTRLLFVILAVVTVSSLAGCASQPYQSGEIAAIVLGHSAPGNPHGGPEVLSYKAFRIANSGITNSEELENRMRDDPGKATDVLAYAVFPSASKGFENIRNGYGRIFVLRPHYFFGFAVYPMATVASDREIIVANGGCVTWEQATGTCQVRFDRAFYSKFGPDPACILPLPLDEQAALSLNVHAGTRYYLELRIDENDGRWHLMEIPEIQGQELVAKKFEPAALTEDRHGG